MNKLICMLTCLVFSFASLVSAQEKLQVSRLFSDGVILQQQEEVPIWGWAIPGAKITIRADWGESCRAVTDKSGKWIARLRTPKAGGPHSVTVVTDQNRIIIKDVLIGEVWLCSGQSNMDMPLKGWPPNDPILNSEEEIKEANYPLIRAFNVAKDYKMSPAKDVVGGWMSCTPETAGNFSATSYYFARNLFGELNVPIGLIHTSHGASPAEAWTAKEDLEDLPRFASLNDDIKIINKNWGAYKKWLAGVRNPNFKGDRNFVEFSNVVIGDEFFQLPEHDDSAWKTVKLPATWKSHGFEEYDGVMWYRKTIKLDGLDASQPLELHLGRIDDGDECYFNGKKIGESLEAADRYKERVYTVPASLLKEGENTIAIRIIDTWGKAGFLSEGKPVIQQNGVVVKKLTDEWKYLPTAQYLGWKLLSFDNPGHGYYDQPYLPFLVEQLAPTALYNAMLLPVIPYKVKGVIWYQGESNTDHPEEYKTLFPRMIKRWRTEWNEELPFYYAQIAPYKNYDNNPGKNTAELREAQFMSQSLTNTGMAVLLDIGDQWCIHPANKKDVGHRLARWALAKQYGKNIIVSGPAYKSVRFEGSNAFLSFDSVGQGLELKDGPDELFQIAGADGKFVAARAEIKGLELVVWSDEVKKPTQVKYAFSNWVEPTLYNKDGLPASSFRTN